MSLICRAHDGETAGTGGDERGNVVLETSLGSVCIELYWDEAPKTCLNFYSLADKGYYDGCVFHRIIPNFIIQGGDPTNTGRGGLSIYP